MFFSPRFFFLLARQLITRSAHMYFLIYNSQPNICFFYHSSIIKDEVSLENGFVKVYSYYFHVFSFSISLPSHKGYWSLIFIIVNVSLIQHLDTSVVYSIPLCACILKLTQFFNEVYYEVVSTQPIKPYRIIVLEKRLKSRKYEYKTDSLWPKRWWTNYDQLTLIKERWNRKRIYSLKSRKDEKKNQW